MKFPNDTDMITVQADTKNFKCAYISIQNNTVCLIYIHCMMHCLHTHVQCPVNDLLRTATSRGIFQTMSTSAVLTVRVSTYVCSIASIIG